MRRSCAASLANAAPQAQRTSMAAESIRQSFLFIFITIPPLIFIIALNDILSYRAHKDQ